MKLTDEIKNKISEKIIYVTTYKVADWGIDGLDTTKAFEVFDSAKQNIELFLMSKEGNHGIRLDLNGTETPNLFKSVALMDFLAKHIDYIDSWEHWSIFREIELYASIDNTKEELYAIVKQTSYMTDEAAKLIANIVFEMMHENHEQPEENQQTKSES